MLSSNLESGGLLDAMGGTGLRIPLTQLDEDMSVVVGKSLPRLFKGGPDSLAE